MNLSRPWILAASGLLALACAFPCLAGEDEVPRDLAPSVPDTTTAPPDTAGLTGPTSEGTTSAGTFAVIFQCEPEAWRSLFPEGKLVLQGRMKSEDFTARELRARIAALANSNLSTLQYDSAITHYGVGPSAFTTVGGNGLLFRETREEGSVELSLCELREHLAVRHLATRRLEPASVLLLGLELEGQPYVIAVRSEVLAPGGSKALASDAERRRAFHQGLEDTGPSRLNLAASEAPADAARCLEIPPRTD